MARAGACPAQRLLHAATVRPRRQEDVWDWFHINSIFQETDGNLLICSRNTWAVYQIGHSGGEVLWRLGGRHSSFALGPGVRFAWQHDATLLPDGTIEIFDNEATPAMASQSRGIDVAVDLQTHTATLLHQYLNPGQGVLSASQGDVQQLANGDQLIGWGQIGLVTELSPTVALTFQLKLPANVQSYRAYRFPWTAQPAAPPVVAASRARRRGDHDRRRELERRHRRRGLAGAGRRRPDDARAGRLAGRGGRVRDADPRRDDRRLRRRRGARHERPGARAGDARCSCPPRSGARPARHPRAARRPLLRCLSASR